MKRTFVRLLLGYWGLAFALTLVVFMMSGVHQLLSEDPSAGDGDGFALAFLWLVLAAPWPVVWPQDGMMEPWMLLVGMLINSVMVATVGAALKGAWQWLRQR